MADDVGAAVGQKMRSAIKAKLTELDCYVDDELPDYIMVMIANKRTRSQMKDDLQLFLSSKTTVFVDWLIIVLKRLKEVHVTNPDVFKKPGKRKCTDVTINSDDLKKIKKEKKEESKALKKARKDAKASKDAQKSLTDDLPITANKLAGLRKIVVMPDVEPSSSNMQIVDDSFDIPLLSEINVSNEDELELIERKIKSVKTRLGLLVESDEEDCLNIKADPEDLLMNDQLRKSKQTQNSLSKARKIIVEEVSENVEEEISYSPKYRNDNEVTNTSDSEDSSLRRHAKITFDKDKDSMDAKYASILNKRKSESQQKKKSILDRLGKRTSDFSSSETNAKRSKSNFNEENVSRDFRRDLLHDGSNRQDYRNKQEANSNQEGGGRNDFDVRQEGSQKQEDIRNRLKARFTGSRGRDSRETRDENKAEKQKDGIMSRLGVMSKISIPAKRAKSPEVDDEEEMAQYLKDVPSVVKVKPRVLPPKAKQANPNLLLKAVAEAQRSVAQSLTTTKSTIKRDEAPALFTKKYKEKYINKSKELVAAKKKPKLMVREKKKLQDMLNKDLINNSLSTNRKQSFDESDSDDYKTYTPPRKYSVDEPNGVNQQFIVTLDGIHTTKFGNSQEKTIIKTKRTPSPIVFDKPKPIKAPKLSNIPDKLPIVPGLKHKEKCKFWPGCRQGGNCEFSHPSTTCKMFPNCKFEDKCLYIHPSCKFEASCTRRDCPYSHKRTNKTSRVPASSSAINVQKAATKLQVCKFFPNCSNAHCVFYHPRLCKFGQYCKNQKECNFVHSFGKSGGSGGNLTWRPEHKV